MARPALLLAVIVCVALNLRPALSSVAAVIDQVAAAFRLGNAPVGLLTMLPPFCFGLAGMLVTRKGQKWDVDRILMAALVILCLGLALRVVPLVTLTYLGTILAGFGIGMAGICLPVVIKRDFSFSIGIATGVFTMAMCVGGALAAAITRPLQNLFALDWNLSLGFWALPALLAAGAWWLWVLRRKAAATHLPGGERLRLWRNPLAWSVTCFMGFQAGLAFVTFGWMPALLQDRGIDPVSAGYVTSISIFGQWITALLVPTIAARMRTQYAPMILCLAATSLGLTGILLDAPQRAAWWGLLAGLGQGGTFGLSLVLISLRSASVSAAMALSGMSQGIGYIIAAAVPLLTGLVRQWTEEASAQLALFLATALIALITGLPAARGGSDRRIG